MSDPAKVYTVKTGTQVEPDETTFGLTGFNTDISTRRMESPIHDISSTFILGNELHEFLERESLGYNVYPGAERVVYDFTAERLNMYTTNLIVSTAHLIKGSLGVGILSMHVGFMYGGLWTSLIATLIIGTVVSYCMLMLVRSAQKMYVRLRIPMMSYPDLVEAAVAIGPWKRFRKFRKTFRYLLDSCLFINMCGICCIYEIMIAITIKQAIETVSPAMKETNLTVRCYILLVAVPLALLCLIRNLKCLAPFSLAADIFIGACVLITMYFSIAEGGSIHDRPAWKSIHGFFRFSGICLFSIDATGVVMAVENNMRKPKYFPIVLQHGTIIVLICLSLVGFFGYWGWGEECKGPITIHMPPTTMTLILQFLLAIMLAITFAVNFWVPFRLLWRYIVRIHKSKRGIWERFYRLIHIVLITGMAVAFPNMIKIMIFFGDFFLGLKAFIFPAFIDIFVSWKESGRGIRLFKNGFLIIFGIVLSGEAFYAVQDF